MWHCQEKINEKHSKLGLMLFFSQFQVFVDQRDENTVAITRHCPATHQSIIMIARTSFRMPAKPNETSYTKPLRLQGVFPLCFFLISFSLI